VTLDRSGGQPLGIDISYTADGTLRVEAIYGGIVLAWNRKNPGMCIRTGDLVLEVNGMRGSSHRLVDACTRELPLTMKIRRSLNLPLHPDLHGLQ